MLRREREGNHFQIGVANFAAIGVVGGLDVRGRAAQQNDAHMLWSVLAIKIIESLFLGVIGFIAIDDFFEISAHAGLLHRLVLVAPSAGGHKNIAQARCLRLCKGLFYARNEVRRVDVISMTLGDL